MPETIKQQRGIPHAAEGEKFLSIADRKIFNFLLLMSWGKSPKAIPHHEHIRTVQSLDLSG